MTYLLDTVTVSELRKPAARADPGVVAWAAAQNPLELYLSVITILEIELGIIRKEQADPVQGVVLRRWLEHDVLPAFDDRILPVDLVIARATASLHVPDPRPERDAMIAATAFVHGHTVVTRNLSDFAPTGVKLLNPWAS
ncbi:MAG: type II toxin-antitoxin system VapC family toxin [Microbacteriaceae bacterium]|nr:MAG: type II toxin-antitoxin system VapC family toxin [Microbacteriaceae bacterium]